MRVENLEQLGSYSEDWVLNPFPTEDVFMEFIIKRAPRSVDDPAKLIDDLKVTITKEDTPKDVHDLTSRMDSGLEQATEILQGVCNQTSKQNYASFLTRLLKLVGTLLQLAATVNCSSEEIWRTLGIDTSIEGETSDDLGVLMVLFYENARFQCDDVTDNKRTVRDFLKQLGLDKNPTDEERKSETGESL